MKCIKCGSNNSIKDASRGDTVCLDCGQVLEENEVVCDVAFENTKVAGTFITDQISGFTLRNKHGNLLVDSSDVRRSKAYIEIQKIASHLLINHYLVDMAKKYYNLASAKKFIQGRKTKHVVAVILYTVCRIQKTRHLLIDFSETLQANLYVLGSIYLKFIRLLQIIVPIVDPCLFIKRYCSKLEFAEKTNLVSHTANKIIQCMDRDWMTTGRRPSGLCGAAILISARFHGFKRSTKQITSVVHVCDDTIRRRLEEFSLTSTAKLTREEFDSLDTIIDDGKGREPPCFIRNRFKEKQESIINKAKAIEKLFDAETDTEKLLTIKDIQSKFTQISNLSNIKSNTNDIKQISNENEKTIITEGKKEETSIFEGAEKFLTEFQSHQNILEKSIKDSNNFTGNNVLNNTIYISKTTEKILDFEESLSEIDEDDISNFVVSQEEYKLKKKLWEILFKDWIDEQKEKKKLEKKEIKKRGTRTASKVELSTSNNPVEAITKSNLLGKKININLLNSMFKKK